MAKTWELNKGNIRVIEDARTASLIIVGRDMKKTTDKINALEKVLEQFKSNTS